MLFSRGLSNAKIRALGDQIVHTAHNVYCSVIFRFFVAPPSPYLTEIVNLTPGHFEIAEDTTVQRIFPPSPFFSP